MIVAGAAHAIKNFNLRRLIQVRRPGWVRRLADGPSDSADFVHTRRGGPASVKPQRPVLQRTNDEALTFEGGAQLVCTFKCTGLVLFIAQSLASLDKCEVQEGLVDILFAIGLDGLQCSRRIAPAVFELAELERDQGQQLVGALLVNPSTDSRQEQMRSALHQCTLCFVIGPTLAQWIGESHACNVLPSPPPTTMMFDSAQSAGTPAVGATAEGSHRRGVPDAVCGIWLHHAQEPEGCCLLI
ncbi:MAG: hypothetical protein ACI841_003481 [Planctomycetota bacterium]